MIHLRVFSKNLKEIVCTPSSKNWDGHMTRSIKIEIRTK